jgi:hypothetical protein
MFLTKHCKNNVLEDLNQRVVQILQENGVGDIDGRDACCKVEVCPSQLSLVHEVFTYLLFLAQSLC